MEIGSTRVDDDGVYFIAEAGVNHNGDMGMAEELIERAASAGADAVKFQTFAADRLTSPSAPKAEYQREQTGDQSHHEMLQQYELSRRDHRRLIDTAAEFGITLLSTPFDEESASLLDELDRPAIKLGSGELNNVPLLKHVSSLGRSMIVSTGMGTMEEVREAYETIRSVDENVPVAFLHCTSAYPAPMTEANLRAMETMDREFPVPVGYSDHTTAVETPGFAVAAGATIVEKHFTLDRTLPGPDHEASLEPDELAEAVRIARHAATARGSREKTPTPSESKNKSVVRKSLHARQDISAGETLTEDDVYVVRPTDGLDPAAYEDVLGKTAVRTLDRGEPITDSDVEEDIQ